jgi:hypothetical protein
MKIHALELPHDDHDSNEDTKQAISGMMDKLYAGKDATDVSPADAR